MNFKNINNFLFVLFLIVLFSCQPLKILPEKKDLIFEYNEVFEKNSTIDLLNYPIFNKKVIDFYDPFKIIQWNNENDLLKLNTFVTFKKYRNNKPLISFIENGEFITLNDKSVLTFYDLNNHKIIKSIKILINSEKNDSYPTSIAKINDNFYVSYSDGKIINFNKEGIIQWEINFYNVLKTPIKIYNNNLIILLADKILYINSLSGDIIWDFTYDGDNSLRLMGGDIVELNHLLFFILPNKSIGEIDTIFAEKNDSILSNINFVNTINNSSSKIFRYKNILSFFDQNKYLTTIDISKNKILLKNKPVDYVNSFIFFNNSLITLHKDGFLKASNILNRHLFWEIDLVQILDKNDRIIQISSFSQSLIIFFKSGIIIQVNPINGELISKTNLKIKDIKQVRSTDNYILIDHNKGRTSLFLQ